MGRIPLPNTGDSQMDTLFTMIDEQLGELYSQYGVMYQRSPEGSNSIIEGYQRVVGNTVPAGGVAISLPSGVAQGGDTSFVDVTNLTVSITTSGRPVMVGCLADRDATFGNSFIAAGAYGWIGGGKGTMASFKCKRDLVDVGIYDLALSQVPITDGDISVPACCLKWIDVVAAGSYTYKLQARTYDVGTHASIWWRAWNTVLFAYEL